MITCSHTGLSALAIVGAKLPHCSFHCSLTKVKTAFVHLLCYLNKPNTSKTHRSDDLFINAAIIQLN